MAVAADLTRALNAARELFSHCCALGGQSEAQACIMGMAHAIRYEVEEAQSFTSSDPHDEASLGGTVWRTCAMARQLDNIASGLPSDPHSSGSVLPVFDALEALQSALGVQSGDDWAARFTEEEMVHQSAPGLPDGGEESPALADAQSYCKDARALLPLLRSEMEKEIGPRQVVFLCAFEDALTTAIDADAVKVCWEVLGAAHDILGCFVNDGGTYESEAFGGLVEGISACLANARELLEDAMPEVRR